jgi:xanthine dehydrogenase accessory factor
MAFRTLLRGGGDLSSGVAIRLHRAGIPVIISELAKPLAVRRLVAFAQAVYSDEINIEGVTGKRAASLSQAEEFLSRNIIPVMVDPEANIRNSMKPQVIIDGRMTKQSPDLNMDSALLVIGLGPGFVAGVNCHAVIETMRGPAMGRVIWQGSAEPDTGLPESVALKQGERVLRAPADGRLATLIEIGSFVRAGEVIAEVEGTPVHAAFDGYLRGLLQSGLVVQKGLKIGDVDPRPDPHLATLVSDKALAVGGGVLEAILSRPELRPLLWK